MTKVLKFKFLKFKFSKFKFSKFKFLGIGQKNNEGPPDLDEVLRDLSQKINNLFGKKDSGNGGGNNRATDGKGFDLPIVPILALIDNIKACCHPNGYN